MKRKLRKSIKYLLIAISIALITPHALAKIIDTIGATHERVNKGVYIHAK